MSSADLPLTIILLAAGLSRRMGAQNKLLMPYRDGLLIHRMADAVRDAAVAERIVVCGHQAPEIEKALAAYPFRPVYNPDFASGMTSSIQAGVRAAGAESQGYMICLSDLPGLKAKDLNTLARAFFKAKKEREHPILQPVHQGRSGHPLIFDASYRSEIMRHPEPDGCREILKAHPLSVRTFEMPDQRIFRDVDDPEDYQKLVKDSPF